ncbi:MAG: SLC13 family permease [Woeseia sp.]
MSLTPHAIAAIFLTISALVIISRARFAIEYSCAGILIALVAIFELFPVTEPQTLRGSHFLAGFGNEALISICLLLMLAKGIEASGALRPIGRLLTRLWLRNQSLALLATLITSAFISSFTNNTPIVVMLLPILVGVAHSINVAPSKILMPAGFATIIGGMSTTIGTSTNLLVVSVAADLGMPRMQVFDFVVPALLTACIGILYLWLVLPKLLPDRTTALASTDTRIFESALTLDNSSPVIGTRLSQVMRTMGDGIRITRIRRGSDLELVRLPTLTLQAGDQLSIRGTPEEIQKASAALGITVAPVDLSRTNDERIVEIVVTRNSPLHQKRLSQLPADTLRGLSPIGWHRPGQRTITRMEKAVDPLLRTGDVLLLQGQREDIQKLTETSSILVLAKTIPVPRQSKVPVALSIMAGVVVVAALGILPISASALCGVGLMLISRCLTWNEAWRAVDTRLTLVIVTSLALGTMLVGTGAAEFIAHNFVKLVEGVPPPYVLSALLLATALLTEVVTNNAIAVIATPIAISVAHELGLPPTPFVLAVLFGANMSYLTPIGYQTNLLVMSAGGYRFADFFRGGLPLQILLWLALSFILTIFYL